MRKALCFGSLNIDYVYDVPHIRPGDARFDESIDLSVRKGLNQSIALAKAGVATFHAGAVGEGASCCLRRFRTVEWIPDSSNN